MITFPDTQVVIPKLLPIVVSTANQTLTFSSNTSLMEGTIRWCMNGKKLSKPFEEITSNQQTTLILHNLSPDGDRNGATIYRVNSAEICSKVHKAVPVHYNCGNITANWFVLHIIEG